jgi:hypothetical protein
MITKDNLFETGDRERIWQKYCGFFDLSLQEFMEIQEQLLMEQIELVNKSPLAKKLMPKKPTDMAEFRKLVPLTTYDDYAAYLDGKNEDGLAAKPYVWCHTSGRGGTLKWVPYSEQGIENFVRLCATTTILACTTSKGEINFGNGIRVLQNMPPVPYISGLTAQLLADYFDARMLPPCDKYQDAKFEERMQVGFQMALRHGVDMLVSLTTVLVKMGESFTESSGKLKFSRRMLHPRIMWTLIRALLRSKRAGRPILPKDLWPLKGLICYGTDTAIYRQQLIDYWGIEPFEIYASTEIGVVAVQAWNRKSMTFVPSACFLEFIPEEEWHKNRENEDYQPSTVLLNEVKPGERYEVIITSFYGMPFLRYRIGDLIKIIALKDEEASINLPQMAFESRADGIIDIAGFARFDEKTIWQAIFNTGIKFEDWSARKEYDEDKPILRLYIELKEEVNVKELEKLVHQQLVSLNRDYRDVDGMLGIQALRTTILPAGSFQRFYDEKQKAGLDLAHLKPPHTNASDAIIQDLVKAKGD